MLPVLQHTLQVHIAICKEETLQLPYCLQTCDNRLDALNVVLQWFRNRVVVTNARAALGKANGRNMLLGVKRQRY